MPAPGVLFVFNRNGTGSGRYGQGVYPYIVLGYLCGLNRRSDCWCDRGGSLRWGSCRVDGRSDDRLCRLGS